MLLVTGTTSGALSGVMGSGSPQPREALASTKYCPGGSASMEMGIQPSAVAPVRLAGAMILMS
ncbi:hypothetical protein CYJ26_07275 [Actinomyces urogenitalis]|uniref:Uncharacterized protein n=1 Tax=Actinomyces urogenitalis TaxID=103621 RepID=A0A2I1KSK4_9ACTO|nr:hypothetical protein HMPREF1626_04100 [Actinomyces urogenitalis S6-C4]PKY98605.1 hypothetical protein CYJ26_07275 [Actinomyces urogenitalis]